MLEKIKMAVLEAWSFFRFLMGNYFSDNCQTTAAALTYQTLFAVVPALTVMYTVLSAFSAFGDMGKSLEDIIFSNVIPENVAVIQDYLKDFSDQARSLSIPSLIFLAVTAFLMLFTIERTFNEIWQIKEPRQGFQRLMMYWAVLTLGPLLVVTGIAITTYVLSLPMISGVSDSPTFLKLLPVLLSAATLTLIYIAVPNTKVPVLHGIVGGLLVALAFESAKFLFAFIMSRSDFQVIYGTFAVVPLFLLWIYISWTIVLVGAELVKAIGVYRFTHSEALEAPFIQIMILLETFFHAHQSGMVVSDKTIRGLANKVNLQQWNEYRRLLIELNLIKVVEKGGLVLSRDLNQITVWQLYRSLPWRLPTHSEHSQSSWQKTLSETFDAIAGHTEQALNLDIESVFRASVQAEPIKGNPI